MKRKDKNKDLQQVSCSPVEKVCPDPEHGLTAAQVRERVECGLMNVTEDSASMSTSDIIKTNILTYFNLIFFIIAGILLLVGSYNNLTFLVVVILNTAIGIIQELRSKRTLDRLTIMAEPEVTVIRDGHQKRIHSSRLVRDDIAVFRAGNQICADAVVCAGQLVVNEALVTGEADEIPKKPGDELLSGSFVISGEAKARAEHVGGDAFVAKLTRDAKKIKKQQQPGMIRSLTSDSDRRDRHYPGGRTDVLESAPCSRHHGKGRCGEYGGIHYRYDPRGPLSSDKRCACCQYSPFGTEKNTGARYEMYRDAGKSGCTVRG